MQRPQVIEELRERIRRIERRPPRSERVLASGWDMVDRLTGGGFPRGALAEVSGVPGSGKTALALAVVARVIEEGGLAAYVDGRGELYAPAAKDSGVDLERLLIVRPPRPCERSGGEAAVRDALWAAEALLGSGAFAAVILDVPVAAALRGASRAEAAQSMLRRVRGAAEKGNALGLWLGEPGECRVPAAVRLEVARGADGPIVRRSDATMVAGDAG